MFSHEEAQEICESHKLFLFFQFVRCTLIEHSSKFDHDGFYSIILVLLFNLVIIDALDKRLVAAVWYHSTFNLRGRLCWILPSVKCALRFAIFIISKLLRVAPKDFADLGLKIYEPIDWKLLNFFPDLV